MFVHFKLSVSRLPACMSSAKFTSAKISLDYMYITTHANEKYFGSQRGPIITKGVALYNHSLWKTIDRGSSIRLVHL